MNLGKNLQKILITFASTTGLSQEERIRFQYFSLFLLFGIPQMLVFGIINFNRGIYWLSALATLSACALAFGWLLIKYCKKGAIVYRINSALYLLLLSSSAIYGGDSGSKILWMYTFPLVAFFLFGRDEGAIWSGTTVTIFCVLFFFPGVAENIYPYSNEFKVRFLASYFTVTGMTFWLEHLRNDYRTRLETQNRALNDEIVERKRIETERELLINEVQSANQAKSEFLANMSHEIRTPLNGVIGMTAMLLDTKLDKDQKHYANTLHTSGEFLLTIINDILDVSKIEAGKFELNINPFDLRDMLDRFIDIVARKIYKSRVDLVVWADPGLPACVAGDVDRLQQILLNLVSNALKFTPDGSVKVKVSLREEDSSHITLLFSIVDTGIGIANEDQSMLFHSFSQIDTPTTREYCGTGLGLNISKQLCERMGGEIGVESTPGEGSEFWFVARLEKCRQHRDKVVPVPALQGKSVLLSTENEMLAEMLSKHLIHWGADVQSVAAVERLNTLLEDGDETHSHKDLVIIDQACLAASQESSFSFYKWLQKMVNIERPRVILLQEDNEQAPEISEISPTQIVTLKKPVRYSDLCGACSSNEVPVANLTPVSSPVLKNNTKGRKAWHDCHILLAEDNPINREVLVGLLAKSGIKQVDTVDNGLGVLSALKRKTYHLILMDVSMPKMDGLTVTTKIRNTSFTANSHKLPIIALTAHAIAGDRERCLKAGMDDYLTKPINPEELFDKLEMWLKVPSDATSKVTNVNTDEQCTTVEDNVAHFDYKALRQRMLGDEALTLELLNLFLKEAPKQLKELEDHINKGELKNARETAHKLAGGAANLSINRMHALIREIEANCYLGKSEGQLEGKAEQLKELLAELHVEFLDAQQIIRKRLQ